MKLRPIAAITAMAILATTNAHAISTKCNMKLKTEGASTLNTIWAEKDWLGKAKDNISIKSLGGERYQFIIDIAWSDGYRLQHAEKHGTIDANCKINVSKFAWVR